MVAAPFQQVLPVSVLVAFFVYLEMFYQPVRDLSNVWEQVQTALAGADRVGKLLQEEPEIRRQPNSRALAKRA